jgi:hypothetical protein
MVRGCVGDDAQTISPLTSFYTAAGWGVAVIATFPWLIWALIVSIMMLVTPEAGAARAATEAV